MLLGQDPILLNAIVSKLHIPHFGSLSMGVTEDEAQYCCEAEKTSII